MDTKVWPYFGAVSGILFVAFLFGGELLPIGENARMVVELLGFLFFIPFLAYLWSILRRAEGEGAWLSATAFGAGIVNLAIKVGSVMPIIAARQAGLDPSIQDAFHAMNDAAFILTMPPLSIMLASVAVLVLGTKVLPAWLGWFSAITALLLLINGMFLEADFGPAFLLFLLWTVLTSVALVRRISRVDGEDEPVPSA